MPEALGSEAIGDIARSELFEKLLDGIVKRGIKQRGFGPTYRSLKKGKLPKPGIYDVNGILEYKESGQIDASLDLENEQGVLVIQNAACTNLREANGESLDATRHGEPTAEELIAEMQEKGSETPAQIICQVEVCAFNKGQREVVLTCLWEFILHNRTSKDRNIITGVGAAVRKYVALMPMDQMDKLATLLVPLPRTVVSPELELEIAKMVYRNFEVKPPEQINAHPELAQQLWEMVQIYSNPRILLRDKNASIASLSIEALVALQSDRAEAAWKIAKASPLKWFGEIVSDDLFELASRWAVRSSQAAAWLADLRDRVEKQV